MPIAICGKSRCSLCEDILQAEDELVGIRHMLVPEHPLWRFSDSTVHRRCFESWKHREYFDALHEKWKELVSCRPDLMNGRTWQEFSAVEQRRIIEQIDAWEAEFYPAWREALHHIHVQYGFA